MTGQSHHGQGRDGYDEGGDEDGDVKFKKK